MLNLLYVFTSQKQIKLLCKRNHCKTKNQTNKNTNKPEKH